MRSRPVAIWLLLVAATLFSLSLFAAFSPYHGAHYVSYAVLSIAFIKARFIGLDFMELRSAPRPLRLAFEVWLLVVAGTLMALYWR